MEHEGHYRAGNGTSYDWPLPVFKAPKLRGRGCRDYNATASVWCVADCHRFFHAKCPHDEGSGFCGEQRPEKLEGDLIMHTNVDLIVIGGGSAGMAAAISGALAGLTVVVFDASGVDFDKPCGEGLMPPAIDALDKLGVKIPESKPFKGVRYILASGKTLSAEFTQGKVALGVRRRVLRHAMWQRALEVGVKIVERRVTRVNETSAYVIVEEYQGRWLCLATGSKSPILKQLRLNDPRRRSERPLRVGARRHARIRPWSDHVEVYWNNDCELYVTPVSEAQVNIAILSRTPRSFDASLKLFPAVNERLAQAVWDDTVGAVAPLEHRASSVQRGRVFVAGDAAGFLDAMTGEGNTLAIRSGLAVTESIVRNNGSGYRWLWLGIVWRYWLVTSVALGLNRNESLQRLLLSILARWPILFRWSVRFLSHSPDQDMAVKSVSATNRA